MVSYASHIVRKYQRLQCITSDDQLEYVRNVSGICTVEVDCHKILATSEHIIHRRDFCQVLREFDAGNLAVGPAVVEHVRHAGNATEIEHAEVEIAFKFAGMEHTCKSRHFRGVPVSHVNGSQAAALEHPAHIGYA